MCLWRAVDLENVKFRAPGSGTCLHANKRAAQLASILPQAADPGCSSWKTDCMFTLDFSNIFYTDSQRQNSTTYDTHAHRTPNAITKSIPGNTHIYRSKTLAIEIPKTQRNDGNQFLRSLS